MTKPRRRIIGALTRLLICLQTNHPVGGDADPHLAWRSWAASLRDSSSGILADDQLATHCPEEDTTDQYTAFPYPPRDPMNEKLSPGLKAWYHDMASNPASISHFVFNGAALPSPFRILIAGGGTGDATVTLAQNFANAGHPLEIVHVDRSLPSMEIARQRLAVRGLEDSACFVAGDLMTVDLDELVSPCAAQGGGAFDLIESVGVLHHLKRPADGLARLAEVLSPAGGAYIMLYGELGRTGVYHFQEAWRRLRLPRDPKLARALLEQLPATNWLKRNEHMRGGDLSNLGDAGLVDMLLHTCDRPFRVADVVKLANDSGLRITEFMNSDMYRLAAIGTDGTDAEDVKRLKLHQLSKTPMGWMEEASVTELLRGDIYKHYLYLGNSHAAGTATGSKVTAATVPCTTDNFLAIRWMFPPEAKAEALSALSMTFSDPYGNVYRHVDPLVSELLEHVDCRRDVSRLHKHVISARNGKGLDLQISVQAVVDAMQSLYAGQGTLVARVLYQLQSPAIHVERHISPFEPKVINRYSFVLMKGTKRSAPAMPSNMLRFDLAQHQAYMQRKERYQLLIFLDADLGHAQHGFTVPSSKAHAVRAELEAVATALPGKVLVLYVIVPSESEDVLDRFCVSKARGERSSRSGIAAVRAVTVNGANVVPFRPANEDAVNKLDAKAWQHFMQEHMNGRGTIEISLEEAKSFLLRRSEQVRMVQEKKHNGEKSSERTW